MQVLIILIMSLTMLCVLAGSVIMVIGGEINEKYGNKLMQARIFAQALAVVLVYLLYAQNT